jgi:chromosome segregation ATPase
MSNGLTLESVSDDLDSVKTIMFTLARQYERVDLTVDRIALQQESNTEAIGSLAIQMNQLTAFMMQQAEFMRETRAEILQMQAEVKEMQSEVRGLQVENRRILQRILGDEF